jgi:hypothetical protein
MGKPTSASDERLYYGPYEVEAQAVQVAEAWESRGFDVEIVRDDGSSGTGKTWWCVFISLVKKVRPAGPITIVPAPFEEVPVPLPPVDPEVVEPEDVVPSDPPGEDGVPCAPLVVTAIAASVTAAPAAPTVQVTMTRSGDKASLVVNGWGFQANRTVLVEVFVWRGAAFLGKYPIVGHTQQGMLQAAGSVPYVPGTVLSIGAWDGSRDASGNPIVSNFFPVPCP